MKPSEHRAIPQEELNGIDEDEAEEKPLGDGRPGQRTMLKDLPFLGSGSQDNGPRTGPPRATCNVSAHSIHCMLLAWKKPGEV
ncbi:unnamed protein product [Boreogadus saida]